MKVMSFLTVVCIEIFLFLYIYFTILALILSQVQCLNKKVFHRPH